MGSATNYALKYKIHKLIHKYEFQMHTMAPFAKILFLYKQSIVKLEYQNFLFELSELRFC